LEVAPGLRPRLPIQGTQFVDISTSALNKLKMRGALTEEWLLSVNCRFPDASYDLLCALDIIEHVDDDEGALAELSRVAAAWCGVADVYAIASEEWWTPFDDFVGHRRRYKPERTGSVVGATRVSQFHKVQCSV
jgi:hypothetical protein